MTINFHQEALALTDELVARRRDFHRHPELAFREIRTANIVAEELNALGLEVRTGVGRTGVVGLLEGQHDGPTVLIRADMDALPVTEARLYATLGAATAPPFRQASSLGLYANYYVANGVVLVPVYGDANDARAKAIISEHFPSRKIVGILAHVLAELGGMIHCVTQQQPLGARQAGVTSFGGHGQRLEAGEIEHVR